MEMTPAFLFLAFAGFQHFDRAVSVDVVQVRMSNNHTVGGPVSTTRVEPNWLRPRENPAVFQGYEVFIRMCVGTSFGSRFLGPEVTIPDHNPAQEVPVSVELELGVYKWINEGEFQPYDPARPPTYEICSDYLFITRQGTRDIYWTMMKLKKHIFKLYHEASEARRSLGQRSQRSRKAQ